MGMEKMAETSNLSLPTEIFELLCSVLHDKRDIPTLKAVSSTNRDIRQIAIPFLFRRITLDKREWTHLTNTLREKDQNQTPLSFSSHTRHVKEIKLLSLPLHPSSVLINSLGSAQKLFPNVTTLYLPYEMLYDLVELDSYEIYAFPPSPNDTIRVIQNLADPTRIVISAKGSRRNGYSHRWISVKEKFDQLVSGWRRIDNVEWHGIAAEQIGKVPGAHHLVHYMDVVPTYCERPGDIHQVTSIVIPERYSSWKMVGVGLMNPYPCGAPLSDTSSMNLEQEFYQYVVQRETGRMAEDKEGSGVDEIEWVLMKAANSFSCDCYS